MLCRSLTIMAILLLSSPAFAASDVVYLKNGSRISGEVMEVMVDDYVSIRLADGRVKTIPWADLDRIDEGQDTTLVAPSPDPKRPPMGTLEFNSGDQTVEIRHITSAGSAIASSSSGQFATAYTQGWQHLCTTPCTIDMLPGNYQIQAAGGIVTPGDLFIEVTPNQHRSYDIKPGNFAKLYGGAMLATLGGVSALMGSIYLLSMPDSEHRGAHTTLVLFGLPSGILGWRMTKNNVTSFEER